MSIHTQNTINHISDEVRYQNWRVMKPWQFHLTLHSNPESPGEKKINI